MRLAGLTDYRWLTGPVNLPFTGQDPKYFSYLTPDLGITVTNTTAQKAASDWVNPTSLTSYQIYPGGPTYTIQAAPATLQSTTLQPDPQLNPLGLFFSSGNVNINGNVTVNGSLFCDGNIQITGTNNVLQAVALPSLAGTTGPVRLAAAGCQNFTVNTAAGGQVTGPLIAFNNFQIQQGSVSMAFNLAGELVARTLCIQQRTEWNQLNWGWCNSAFQTAKWLHPLTVKYFPVWMNQNYNLSPASNLNFAPESPAATYHWASSYSPIFVPNPSDGGLRWDLLSWTENV